MDPEEEGASELGTHTYWEGAYSRELVILESTGDEGEVWFGEETMLTMVDWTCHLLEARGTSVLLDLQLLDIGTGNGAMLVALSNRGFTKLTGSDYSKTSLSLAAAVLEKNGCTDVDLVLDDITDCKLPGRFDVLLDKGTYDAIGLSEHAEHAKRAYRAAAAKLLSVRGVLVITSCNSTLGELRQEFTAGECIADGAEDVQFEYVDHVKTYPTFRFGGVEGTHHCTVAFTAKAGQSQ